MMFRRRLMLGAVVVGAVLLGIALFAGWRFFQRPMFEPRTVAARVASAGENLEPVRGAKAEATRWHVAQGIELRHEAVGEGRDVVVVHGGPGLPYAHPWRAAKVSSSGIRWHFYDQRGCGDSSRPFDRAPGESTWKSMQAVEAKLGLAEQVADLERIRRLLGKERLTLVGHSFGALIAALYAAEWPDRVEALTLVAPAPLFVMPVEDGDLFSLIRSRLPPDSTSEYDAYLRRYFDFRAHIAKDETSLSSFFGEFGRFYRLAARRSPPEGEVPPGGFLTLALYLSLGKRHDWTSVMRQVRAPVLLIHGEEDLQPRAATERVASLFPKSHLQALPDAGHFPFDEQPEAFAQAISDFLRGSR
jgi:proline iminopeptidase